MKICSEVTFNPVFVFSRISTILSHALVSEVLSLYLFSLPLCRLSPSSSLKQIEVILDLYEKPNGFTFRQFPGNRPFPLFMIKVRISNIVSPTFFIFLTASISLSAASRPPFFSSHPQLSDPLSSLFSTYSP